MAKMLQSPKAVGTPLPVTSPPSAFPGKVLQAELGQRNMVLPWCVGQVRMWPLLLAGGGRDWCFGEGMSYDVKGGWGERGCLVWGSVPLLHLSWVYKCSPAVSHHAGWGLSSGGNASPWPAWDLSPHHCLCPVRTQDSAGSPGRCWSLALSAVHLRCSPRTLPSHWSWPGVLAKRARKALWYTSIGYR